MAQQHARAIARLLPAATLVGVADPTTGTHSHQALAPDVQTFVGLEAMLESLRPDVVHIVTPPHTHAIRSPGHRCRLSYLHREAVCADAHRSAGSGHARQEPRADHLVQDINCCTNHLLDGSASCCQRSAR